MENKHELTVGPNKIYAVVYTPEKAVSDTPIILVHGSWGGTWMWDMYAKFLLEKGYKRMAKRDIIYV